MWNIQKKKETCCGGGSLCSWQKPPKIKRRIKVRNVLNFPTRQKNENKKSFIERVKTFFKNKKEQDKQAKERAYQEKIEFLKKECYDDYLKRILKSRRNIKVVDFPDFMYYGGSAISVEARRLADDAVEMTERKYGRKHIERCYEQRIKDKQKNRKK